MLFKLLILYTLHVASVCVGMVQEEFGFQLQHALPVEYKNVLLIVSDDLRPEMGCYGGEAITPELDSFASSVGAVTFTRAYVQQAICNPTRSSFLVGRRPDTTLVWDLDHQFRNTPGNHVYIYIIYI